MAKMDINATLALGFLIGLLPEKTRFADIKIPEYGADLNETPIEVSFVNGDGKKVHLKISDIMLEVPTSEEK